MGKCSRNWMVRDKFIAAQRSCGLRRHLDNVPPDTPTQDIVDCCRVWETGFFRSNSLKPVGCPEVDSRIPVPVASVIQSDVVAHRKGGPEAVRLHPWKSCPP